jgi:signal transduction histidine kinase
VSTKTKRTYNISSEAVATVKRLVEELHVAPSQDALVEQAIAELARQVRDAEEARLWEQAAADPEFQAEMRELDEGFAGDDPEVWDR